MEPFISTFMSSTQSAPSKPKYESVIGTSFLDPGLEKPIEPHPLFGNNHGIVEEVIRPGHCFNYFKGRGVRQERGVYDTLVYLCKLSMTTFNHFYSVDVLEV